MKLNISLAFAALLLLEPAFARLGRDKASRKLQNAPSYTYNCAQDGAYCMSPQYTSSLGADEIFITTPTAPPTFNINLVPQESVQLIMNCDAGDAVSNPQIQNSDHIHCSTTYSGSQAVMTCWNGSNKENEFVQLNEYTCGTPGATTWAPTQSPTAEPVYAPSYTYTCPGADNTYCVNPQETPTLGAYELFFSDPDGNAPISFNLAPQESVVLIPKCPGDQSPASIISNVVITNPDNIECNTVYNEASGCTDNAATTTCTNTSGQYAVIQLSEYTCGIPGSTVTEHNNCHATAGAGESCDTSYDDDAVTGK